MTENIDNDLLERIGTLPLHDALLKTAKLCATVFGKPVSGTTVTKLRSQNLVFTSVFSRSVFLRKKFPPLLAPRPRNTKSGVVFHRGGAQPNREIFNWN
jgi:hypothetical protein